jgi:hypothetical protein
MVSVDRATQEKRSFRGPEAWTAQQVQQFVSGLDGGRVRHLAEVFAISGKALSSEWIGHIERRVEAAGGTSEEAHIIYDAFYARNQAFKKSQKKHNAAVASSSALPSHSSAGRKSSGDDVMGTASARRPTATSSSIASLRKAQREKFAQSMKSAEDVVFSLPIDSASLVISPRCRGDDGGDDGTNGSDDPRRHKNDEDTGHS